MTVNNRIRINGKEVDLNSIKKEERQELIKKMNIRAVSNFNYVLKEEKTA